MDSTAAIVFAKEGGLLAGERETKERIVFEKKKKNKGRRERENNFISLREEKNSPPARAKGKDEPEGALRETEENVEGGIVRGGDLYRGER